MKKIAVIGDVHGCFDELVKLVETNLLPIIDTLEHIVFVGDYIDRGPKSKEVFEYVQNIPKVVMLKGNHEDMMVDGLVNGKLDSQNMWLYNGGKQTLDSYSTNMEEAFKSALADAIKMERLPLTFKFGRVVVSHAGLNPIYALKDQSEKQLIWGRDFANYGGVYEENLFAIFGHTPVHHITKNNNQMNIDTACVFGGVLSAVIVDEQGNCIDEFAVPKIK